MSNKSIFLVDNNLPATFNVWLISARIFFFGSSTRLKLSRRFSTYVRQITNINKTKPTAETIEKTTNNGIRVLRPIVSAFNAIYT